MLFAHKHDIFSNMYYIPISKDVYSMLTRNNRHLRTIEEDNHVLLYFGKPIDHFSTALKTACKGA